MRLLIFPVVAIVLGVAALALLPSAGMGGFSTGPAALAFSGSSAPPAGVPGTMKEFHYLPGYPAFSGDLGPGDCPPSCAWKNLKNGERWGCVCPLVSSDGKQRTTLYYDWWV